MKVSSLGVASLIAKEATLQTSDSFGKARVGAGTLAEGWRRAILRL
jgi:hypothetical protein